MAEEAEGLDTGAEASAAGVDPAAISIALGAAAHNERVAAKAEAYLEEQSLLTKKQAHLVDLQAKELAHELKLRHWSLQLRHGSAILKFSLEVSLALIGIALACFIGAVVWNAAHADGLIVESFSVPPDLAARGLSGQAVAGQLMDRLSEMQSATVANRAPRSYSNDWDNNINVEIPETGISVGEAYRFLKSWLGHETHVSGDVWREQNGLAIAARVSGNGSSTITGTEADLDSLIEKTAEDIYKRTQPFRYAIYLAGRGRSDEANAIFNILVTTGDRNDRGWAYLNLVGNSSVAELERLYDEAEQYGVPQIASNHAGFESNRGRPEPAMAYYKKAEELLRTGSGGFNLRLVPAALEAVESSEHALLADYRTAAQERAASMVGGLRDAVTFPYLLAGYQIRDHDVTAARKTLESPVPGTSNASTSNQLALLNVGGMANASTTNQLALLNDDMQTSQEIGDWKTVLADAQAMTPIFQRNPVPASMKPTQYDPLTAVAQARLGSFADAEQRISPTLADCYPCLIARADIAEIQGQHARADWWYARAAEADPAIPLAECNWGQALLARGQPDDAIAKFKLSNKKGPHFADPLEGWGEALMAKNRSDLALAKFTEAEKYAPNWGRLHLKWGEALGYAGKPDDAKKQFALAATLDLAAADKTEFARVTAHG